MTLINGIRSNSFILSFIIIFSGDLLKMSSRNLEIEKHRPGSETRLPDIEKKLQHKEDCTGRGLLMMGFS
jgi:hypothetical protein